MVHSSECEDRMCLIVSLLGIGLIFPGGGKNNPQGPYLTYNHAGCSYVYSIGFYF